LHIQRKEECNEELLFLAIGVIVSSVLSSGCVTMRTWPDSERSAESKMVVIQENIGDGLKTGALFPDQVQMYLATLKGICTDYALLRDKRVSREE
jgi:hypothetical protein